MSGVAALRSVRAAPASCALLGCVLVLGTVINQPGPAGADAPASPSPMSGMNMPGMHMSAGGASPAGDTQTMDMSGPSAAGMPGMDMSGAADPGEAPAAMDMSKPGMAAEMPGGFHSICTSAKSCLVVFDKHAGGTASLLGAKTSLVRLTSNAARLRVDGHSVVLRGKKSVRTGGLTMQIVRIDSTEVAIRVVKA